MSLHIAHSILTTNLRGEGKVNPRVRPYFFIYLTNTYVRPTYVLGVFLSNFQILIHSILLSTKWGKYCYHAHFTDGEIETKSLSNLPGVIQLARDGAEI